MNRDLVTGSAVLCAAILLCARIPVAGWLGSTLLPVPLLVFAMKAGPATARGMAVTAILFAGLFGGRFELFFFGGLILAGLAAAEGMVRGASIEKTVLAGCGAAAAGLFAGLWTLALLEGQDPLALLLEGGQRQVEAAVEAYRAAGMAEEQVRFLEESSALIARLMIGILPALVVSANLFALWASLLVARAILAARRLPAPPWGPLDRWRAPEALVWAVIGSGGLLLAPSLPAKAIGLNGVLLLTVIYFFQGIAVVAFTFRRKGVPRMLRALLYALIGLQQLVALGVAVLGLFDTWFDFRKLGRNRAAPASPGGAA
ncbi:MAG: DUF2232 domain-containing protein [Desulfobacterales bacterium]